MKKLKIWFNKFKKLELKKQIAYAVMVLFIIDLTLYLNQLVKNQMAYDTKMISYSTLLKNNKIDLEMKNINLNEAIAKIGQKNIKQISFVINESKDFTTPVIILKNDLATEAKEDFTPSVMKNEETYLKDNNIKFNWVSSTDSINIKPELKDSYFPIYEYMSHNFISLFFYGLMFFYLMRSMPELFGGKYEVIDPTLIEGSIDDLVGLDDIKKEILQLKDMILNSDKYSAYGINGLFNIIFSGPAGTGKTKIAGFLAKELNVPIIMSSGNVETGYVGGGARVLKALFRKATMLAFKQKSKTVIVFLDEAQVLLMKRGQSRDKWSDDSANELLALLDGVKQHDNVKIVFIAASNFDDSNMQIDEAVERRFQKKIFFRLPVKKERIAMFNHYLAKVDNTLKGDIDTTYLGTISAELSGAKIETIVKEASLMAVQKNEVLTTNLMYKAFEKITVGETTRDITENETELRKTIIYHELGHFICNYEYLAEKGLSLSEIKDKIKLLKISSESIAKYKALGFVLNENEGNLLKKRSEYEEDIISLYGGYAAEEIFCGEPTAGAFNDIEKITKLLDKLVVEMGMYSNLKINLNMVKYRNEKEVLSQMQDISNRLYNEAKNRINKNKDLIEHLKNVLEDEWTLSKDELFKNIEDFNS